MLGPEGAFLARLRFFAGCRPAEDWTLVSGTYAHPGAKLVFALASSTTPKLFMVDG